METMKKIISLIILLVRMKGFAQAIEYDYDVPYGPITPYKPNPFSVQPDATNVRKTMFK